MVIKKRVGFICEGDTEKMFVETTNFKNYLKKTIGIEIVGDVINAGGNRNLLPANIREHHNRLKRANPDKIIILTDSDGKTRKEIEDRIKPQNLGHILILAVQEIEAWFLSDIETLRDVLQKPQFKLKEQPEQIQKPSENTLPQLIKKERNQMLQKVAIAKLFLSEDSKFEKKRKHFFKIENAKCNSARTFITQLENLVKPNSNSKTTTSTKPKRKKRKTK